jgi:hypothetical protein
MKKALSIVLVTLVSSVCHAADFPKLCGPAPMGQSSMSGSLAIDQGRGHLTAVVVPTGFTLDVDVQVIQTTPAPLPRDSADPSKVDGDYLNYMSRLGFADPKDGTTYQLVAVDANGQKLQAVSISKDPSDKKIENSIAVTVIPANGQNMLTVSVPLDDSGIFPVFMGTDSCK